MLHMLHFTPIHFYHLTNFVYTNIIIAVLFIYHKKNILLYKVKINNYSTINNPKIM